MGLISCIGHAFYRGADCCALVYDMTNHQSFDDLEKWRDEFFLRGNPPDPESFPFILIGSIVFELQYLNNDKANKSDREAERKVTVEEAQAWCKANNDAPFYEVSAQENINVQEAFNIIAERAHANQKTTQA